MIPVYFQCFCEIWLVHSQSTVGPLYLPHLYVSSCRIQPLFRKSYATNTIFERCTLTNARRVCIFSVHVQMRYQVAHHQTVLPSPAAVPATHASERGTTGQTLQQLAPSQGLPLPGVSTSNVSSSDQMQRASVTNSSEPRPPNHDGGGDGGDGGGIDVDTTYYISSANDDRCDEQEQQQQQQ